MNYYTCDCCNAPMANVTNYRADSCSAGCDTSACVLCSVGFGSLDKDELIQEIADLGEFISDPKVSARIIQLGDVLSREVARSVR